MGVLSAVLANAGRIALDVTWIERGLVEGGPEQQGNPILRTHQFPLRGRHGAGRTFRNGSLRDHRPGLGDAIDPAFVARCRSERRAVIEPAATIPVAVPRLAFER